jgi:hypothetical protein
VWLWVIAILGAVGSAAYQRLTGPTVSLRGTVTLADATYRYRLPRSGTSTTDRAVRLRAAPGVAGASLEYRRFRTQDPWRRVPLMPDGDHLVGHLPRQPAAGKLEYTVTLATTAGDVQLPADGSTVTMRFKDPVPAWVLIPHILLMFTALLVGIRTGLGAAWAPTGLRQLTLATLTTLTLGGLVLGPVVQKLAFGQLTDDKTMIMWLVWVVAAWTVIRAGSRAPRRARLAALSAAVVMLAVFLIPHSVRGSALDYTQVDQGVAPANAVTTGN